MRDVGRLDVIRAVYSTLGEPVCADAAAMANARMMFSRLLDWMVDADEDWLLGKDGAQWFVNVARSRLKSRIKAAVTELTELDADVFDG